METMIVGQHGWNRRVDSLDFCPVLEPTHYRLLRWLIDQRLQALEQRARGYARMMHSAEWLAHADAGDFSEWHRLYECREVIDAKLAQMKGSSARAAVAAKRAEGA